MSQPELLEFVNRFQKFFCSPTEEVARDLYHIPCIVMDRRSIIPINSDRDIVEFYKNLISDIAGDSSLACKCSIISLNNLSETLVKLSVNVQVSYDADRCLVAMLVTFSCIKIKDHWYITVMEIENREMPACLELDVRSKNEELARLSEKIKSRNAA